MISLLSVVGAIVVSFASLYILLYTENKLIAYAILCVYIIAFIVRMSFSKFVTTTLAIGIATGLSLWLLSQYLSPKFNRPFWSFTILFVLMELFAMALSAKKKKEMMEFDKKMSSITKEFIMSDDVAPRDIIDPLFEKVNFSCDSAAFVESLDGFSESQRLILAVELYIDGVMYDGHKLFFYNYSGILPSVLAGLKTIGADDYFEVLKNASKKYEKYVAKYGQDGIVKASDVGFDAEDNFIISTATIGNLEIDYIRKHLDDFLHQT